MKASRRLPPLRMLAPAAALAALALVSCGGGTDEPGAAETSTSGSATHNDADVAFATGMIPHHAQALSMADLAVGRQVDQEFSALLDDIRAAQTPEIELMADWLQEWGEPVPDTMRDHAHGGHDGEAPEVPEGHDMPGMMSAEQLEELSDASAADFEELWLEMMIEHHEGAVSMAETELDEGAYGPALELAEEIATSQTAEIQRMQGMLQD